MNEGLLDHLYELRGHLIKCIAIFILSSFLIFYSTDSFIPYLLPEVEGSFKATSTKELLLENSKDSDLVYELKEGERVVESYLASFTSEYRLVVKPEGFLRLQRQRPETTLFLLSPLEGLFTSLRLSFWIGGAISSPFWLYWILHFVLPALKREEKKVLFPLLFSTLFSASFGSLFTLYGIRPHLQLLLRSSLDEHAAPLWSLSSYIDLFLLILFASFALFELVALLFLLVHFRLIGPDSLSQARRFSWLAAFILGALLTPPDIISQLLFAIPLILFYEIAIFYGYCRGAPRQIFFNKKII